MTALSHKEQLQITDRFRMDLDQLLNPAALVTQAGLRETFGSLFSQLLDARKRYVACPVTSPTGAATVISRVMACAEHETVTRISLVFDTVPSSALGTIVATVNKMRGATVTALSAADFDVEALDADEENSVTLEVLANRRLRAGDVVAISITADNADADPGAGGVLVIELEPTEVAEP